MPLLEFKDIKKRFKKQEVLTGITFFINEGEIFGLAGKSGCGKSTLLKIIMGMLKADKGQMFFEKKNALKKQNYLRRNTGFATQENMLFNELSIKENSKYFGKLYKIKSKDIMSRFEELVSLLGLGGYEDRQISQLSGGMKKRANILVSLIHKPKLLILDEPTVGLDSILRGVLWGYIKKINQEGTTILVTSHLLEEVENNCKRIAIMKNGKIYANATPKEYQVKYGKKPFTEIFETMLK